MEQQAVASSGGVVVQAGANASVVIEQQVRRRAPVSWPVRVGLPPALADHYQPREVEQRLAEVLTSDREAARHPSGVVLCGLGGVGKSQLAARTAWSVWRDDAVDLIGWVDAGGRSAIIAGYRDIAARVLRDEVLADGTVEEVAAAALSWLATTDRRWLLVLDDVADPPT
ncbi:hypothetical protein IOD16_18520 [Saccharothrix sp. 6-C]|nr:hypothetical protein IOD16_18520 [Saccharothrix sp. 6-C]